MIDLEKELKAFEKYNGRPPHSPDEDAEFYGWLERANLAKAEQEKLEEAIESLKAQLAQVNSTNHSLEEINADLSESLKLLKDKYGNDDYVLVPKKPTSTMIDAVRAEHEGEPYLPYSLYEAFIKQAMIEAQEQHNAKP